MLFRSHSLVLDTRGRGWTSRLSDGFKSAGFFREFEPATGRSRHQEWAGAFRLDRQVPYGRTLTPSLGVSWRTTEYEDQTVPAQVSFRRAGSRWWAAGQYPVGQWLKEPTFWQDRIHPDPMVGELDRRRP